MNSKSDRLYNLLPAVYREYDAGQDYSLRGLPGIPPSQRYALRALLGIIADQVTLVEEQITELSESAFIETCPDWMVPYIGELIGYAPVSSAGDIAVAAPRREVANTLRYRARKGTLAVLSALARDTSGWPGISVVEMCQRVATLQHAQSPRPDRVVLPELRSGLGLHRSNPAEDNTAHLLDVRRINSSLTTGRYGLTNIACFVWRLRSYPVTRTAPYRVEKSLPFDYTFSIFGNDTPLYSHPESGDPPHPISRHDLREDLQSIQPKDKASHYYGEGKSLAIYLKHVGTNGDGLVQPQNIIVADLSREQGRLQDALGHGQLALDPETGRIMFPPREADRIDHDDTVALRVSYCYGFSADVGGGEYVRPIRNPSAPQPAEHLKHYVVDVAWHVTATYQLDNAIRHWNNAAWEHRGQPFRGVIEIAHSGEFNGPLRDIHVFRNHTLQIRAANAQRPVLRLQDERASRPDNLYVSAEPESCFILDGVLVAGRGITVTSGFKRLKSYQPPKERATLQPTHIILRHVTLVPGWELDPDCDPKHAEEASLKLREIEANVLIESSIMGSIDVDVNEQEYEPSHVHIADSILDSTSHDEYAIYRPTDEPAYVVLTVEQSTVLGRVQVREVDRLQDSIFRDPVSVTRRQVGCVRFCYIPLESRTPPRYHCQPDWAGQMAEQAAKAEEDPEPEQRKNAAMRSVQLHFNSVRYGAPTYVQLALSCSNEIREGAEDQSEMGVYHHLYQPQRAANLLARLNDFIPFGSHAGIIYVT